jgi:hypothetical protein
MQPSMVLKNRFFRRFRKADVQCLGGFRLGFEPFNFRFQQKKHFEAEACTVPRFPGVCYVAFCFVRPGFARDRLTAHGTRSYIPFFSGHAALAQLVERLIRN